MKRVAQSGMIDGEFLIVKRGKENNIIARITGEECKQNADFIMQTLEDRITGNLSQKETQEHFQKKVEEREKAATEIEKGSVESTVGLYTYPTKTWLKETDGALDFFKKESGLTNIDEIAEWLIKEKFLPQIVADERKVDTEENLAHFDEENRKTMIQLNTAIVALQKAMVESLSKQEEMYSGVKR